jgi:hypothetical protein
LSATCIWIPVVSNFVAHHGIDRPEIARFRPLLQPVS